jgi:hypothetical protein
MKFSFRRRRSRLESLSRVDKDLRDEIRFHLEMRVEELKAEGMEAGEAWREAVDAFGNPEEILVETRKEHPGDTVPSSRVEVWMSAVRDGATDYDVVDKWPDSPSYWGYEDWNEVAPYAIGHGLGLTLHDRPLITAIKKVAGYEPTTLQAGMVLALETYAGHKGGKDGVRLEENILVTDDGYELLSRWPIDELMECWLPYR